MIGPSLKSIGELERDGAIIAIQDGNHGGSHPKSEEFAEDGIPFLMASDIDADGSIDFGGCARLSPVRASRLRIGFARTGDVLLTHKGSVGRVALLRQVDPYVMLTPQVTYYRVNNDLLYRRYLVQALRSNVVQQQLNSLSAQSTRPYISISTQRHIRLPWHPLKIQHKIARILCAYDDLIEVNTRRIAILEEMNRRLFNEWFVKFKYPAAQQQKQVPSHPPGWIDTTLGVVCTLLTDGDWIETKDQGGTDYRLLQVSNIGLGQFVETGNFRYVTQETFTRLRCTEIVPGDILIARMPKPIGRGWLVTQMPWRMITAVDVAIARVNASIADPYFVLYHLNSEQTLALVEKHQSGTTRPRISRSALSVLPLNLPQLSLQRRFGEFAAVLYTLCSALHRCNATLRAARDLLLPKLISGEIDLEQAEHTVNIAAKRAAAE